MIRVRFGSKADMCAAKGHVCFTPKADIERDNLGLLEQRLGLFKLGHVKAFGK
jgi:hypothetical protein